MISKQRWAIPVLLAAIVYAGMAVQPPEHDDFVCFQMTKVRGLLGGVWHLYLTWGGKIAAWFWTCALSNQPYSLFKPAIFFTTVALVSFTWIALDGLATAWRTLLTLIVVLGFPYGAQILACNAFACVYGMSSIFAILSFRLLESMWEGEALPLGRRVLCFATILLSALGSEFWLGCHFGIAAGLLFYFALKNRGTAERTTLLLYLPTLGIALIVFLFGGNMQRLNTEAHGIRSGISITSGFINTAKETLVLLKDMAPIYLLIPILGARRARASFSMSGVLVFGLLGMLGVLFLLEAAGLAFHWRVRFTCAIFLAYFLLRTPFPLWPRGLMEYRWPRVVLSTIAVGILMINVYFSYVSPKFSYGKWFEYRSRVLSHDETLVGSETTWGTQDDRYRVLYPPEIEYNDFALKAYNTVH